MLSFCLLSYGSGVKVPSWMSEMENVSFDLTTLSLCIAAKQASQPLTKATSTHTEVFLLNKQESNVAEIINVMSKCYFI